MLIFFLSKFKLIYIGSQVLCLKSVQIESDQFDFLNKKLDQIGFKSE
jgi:hypothetical protein